jgi:hypothetical protein
LELGEASFRVAEKSVQKYEMSHKEGSRFAKKGNTLKIE